MRSRVRVSGFPGSGHLNPRRTAWSRGTFAMYMVKSDRLPGITARNIPCGGSTGVRYRLPRTCTSSFKHRRSTRTRTGAAQHRRRTRTRTGVAQRRTSGVPKQSSPRRSARPSGSTSGTPSRRRSRRTRCTSRRPPRSVPTHPYCAAAGGASGQSLGAPVHPSSAKRAHLTPAVTAFVAMLMRNDDCDGAKAEAVLTAIRSMLQVQKSNFTN